MKRHDDTQRDGTPDCCFLIDPRDIVRRHTDAAVFAHSDALRAIHLRVAEHQADIVRGSGIAWRLRTPSDLA